MMQKKPVTLMSQMSKSKKPNNPLQKMAPKQKKLVPAKLKKAPNLSGIPRKQKMTVTNGYGKKHVVEPGP